MVTHIQGHQAKVLDRSVWPIVVSASLLSCVVALAVWMNGVSVGNGALIGLVSLVTSVMMWMKDLAREAVKCGDYSTLVYDALKVSLAVFLSTEALFFAGFFWGLFENLWSPTLEVGGIVGVAPFEMQSMGLPFVNTLILLTSGVVVTWSHHALQGSERGQALIGLVVAVGLGVLFLSAQWMEYHELPFALSDGVWGSCFYMLTGFHGFHVLCGTVFLIVATVLVYVNSYTETRSYFYDFALWYWHFVDVVWIFLFLCLYLGMFGF
jgi:heme/copper-type cytochrome/quinol oxidase subunit 3